MALTPKIEPGAMLKGVRADLALRHGKAWLRDSHFAIAMLAGVLFWLLYPRLTEPGLTVKYGLPALGMLVLLQPLMEELVFRGLVQGKLLTWAWGKRRLSGLTLANLTCTTLFTSLHFASHQPLWAAGVFLPSLLFGYFRDRHDSIYPAIALHIFYNAGYFLLPLET